MNGRRGIMKNRGILWRNREANEGQFWKKGKKGNGACSSIFSWESTGFLSLKWAQQ